MECVTIGHISVDKIRIGGRENTQLGGAAVYSAMGAKIFSRTGLVSRVGGDFPAEFHSTLKEAGIDTAGLKRVGGKSTLFDIDYAKDGSANYTRHELNVGIYIRPEDIPPAYSDAQAFHIAPMAASKQRAFIDFLRKRSNAIISLNTHGGYFLKYRGEILDLMPKVDIFTLNDEEAMRLTETKSLEQALNALKRAPHNLLVVTMGVYGSIVVEDEISFFPSLHQPTVIDLTGCGDAFAGAFVASYLKTNDPLKSANIANSVASIVATDWNFQAVRGLKFHNLERFQEFVVSRQRRLAKSQRSLENFL